MKIIVIPKMSHRQYATVLPEEMHNREGLLLGAFEGNSLEGILFAFPKEKDVWQVGHLFVVSDSAGKGLGASLLEACKRETASLGAVRLTAEYYAAGTDPNAEALHRCLAHAGFLLSGERIAMQSSLGEFKKGLPVRREDPEGTKPLSVMEDDTWKGLGDLFAVGRVQKKKSDVRATLYPKTEYHPTLSRFIVDEKDGIQGIILIRPYVDSLSVDYLWCAGGAGLMMMKLIRAAIGEAGSLYPPDTEITLHAENPTVAAIAEKLAKGHVRTIGTLRRYVCDLPAVGI
ncbi:MAG: GNAT family N-acetyltransferase [Lachnospiraceae bacterium]|nr:GNAT family N-acetyltransferase [Lachnospiraceae bacterium]